VFRRLAVTPAPLPNLILGLILAQLVVNIMQVQVLLALGVMFGLEITLPQLLVVEGAVVLGSLAFTAFGAALSTVVHRVDVASTAYVLIMMPLAFTGLLPDLSGVVRLLPSTMFTDLVRIIDGPLDVPTVLIGVGGLLAYTALFLWFAGWRFRWD
ncbi:MAG: ABC transporter permease, partial [Anaerolineae bacterium]